MFQRRVYDTFIWGVYVNWHEGHCFTSCSPSLQTAPWFQDALFPQPPGLSTVLYPGDILAYCLRDADDLNSGHQCA